MNTIEFEGHLIVKDKIVAVDKVTSFSTGTMICDWAYGFTIRLEGNNLDIIYSRSGYLNNDVQKAEVNKKRNEFIALLK
jgi:hypothetical protein